MAASDIRDQVKEFKEKYAYGDDPADCFAPWYLTKIYGLPATEAIRRSAESKQGFNGPGYDFGIDAFHLVREEGKSPILVLIQAKYSDSLNYVAKGIRDFKKGLKWLKYALHSAEAEYDKENKVLVNLRAELSQLSDADRTKVKLEFVVIHLNENDVDIVNNRTRDAQENLKEEIQGELSEVVFKIKVEGPRAIENLPSPDILPSPLHEIRFEGTLLSLDGSSDAGMLQGIGRLSELVDLYRKRKEDLFSKNVRLFISSKKNTEKGPSGKIRETLKAICVDKIAPLPPEIFALYHNGITIHARDAAVEGKKLRFRDPYVLNGCQTITTAYRFCYSQKANIQVNEGLWNRIAVPIRVINTRDESLVRIITVSNNRQNAISAAALRANDPVQIDLEHRMAEKGLFYERQEGAFDFLQDTDPGRLNRVYSSSEWGPINIEDLARCLAASTGEVSVAINVTDLFESDAAYARCFSAKRLASVHLHVFMQNVHNVLTVVLKNDIGLDWTTSYIKTGKIFYFVFCLMMRYLAKQERFDEVAKFSDYIWAKDRALRDVIAKFLGNRCSGIKEQLRVSIMTLENTKMEAINSAFQRIEKKLHLGPEVDVFSMFERFDERFEE